MSQTYRGISHRQEGRQKPRSAEDRDQSQEGNINRFINYSQDLFSKQGINQMNAAPKNSTIKRMLQCI